MHRILSTIRSAGLAILLATSACPAAAARPNVVVFLADDLGYGDPQCLNPKSQIPTPNIDRLSQQGMVFTDAHSASSICTPSRYGLLTGRYCWRSKLPTGITWYWDPPLIDRDRLTMGRMFQENGYATACVGKWHLGWDWPLKDGSYISDDFDGVLLPWEQRDEIGRQIDFTRPIKDGPTTRGFDYYFGTSVPNFPPYCFIENDRTVGIPTLPKPKDMFGRSWGPIIRSSCSPATTAHPSAPATHTSTARTPSLPARWSKPTATTRATFTAA